MGSQRLVPVSRWHPSGVQLNRVIVAGTGGGAAKGRLPPANGFHPSGVKTQSGR
jgi:hypothetical protein